jgi:hypothetical protein
MLDKLRIQTPRFQLRASTTPLSLAQHFDGVHRDTLLSMQHRTGEEGKHGTDPWYQEI